MQIKKREIEDGGDHDHDSDDVRRLRNHLVRRIMALSSMQDMHLDDKLMLMSRLLSAQDAQLMLSEHCFHTCMQHCLDTKLLLSLLLFAC